MWYWFASVMPVCVVLPATTWGIEVAVASVLPVCVEVLVCGVVPAASEMTVCVVLR